MNINNRDFKAVKKLLDIMFDEGYSIIEFDYKEGDTDNLDGLRGFKSKPQLEIIVLNNNNKYKFNFCRDYQITGSYWYWEIKHKQGIKGTCFFEGYDNKKNIDIYNEEHRKYLYMYIQ